MHDPPRALLALFACAFSLSASDTAKLPPASSAQTDFDADIKPLLAAQCVKCHGADKPKGGLRLDSRAAALDPETDRLVKLLARFRKSADAAPKDAKNLPGPHAPPGAPAPEAAARVARCRALLNLNEFVTRE